MSLEGLWADLGFNVTAEDIAEARREMWGNFPKRFLMSLALDTHAVIWYFLGSNQLSAAGLNAIRNSVNNGKRVYVSAISIVEMVYLTERGRISHEALQELDAAAKNPNSGIVVVALDAAIAETVKSIW